MATDSHQQPTHPYVIGMDLGGTKILAAIVDAEGHIVAEAKNKTRADQGPDKVIDRLAQTASEAVEKAGLSWHQIAAIGVGAPGPIDPEAGIVYTPPNLPGWEQVALGPRLSEKLGVPVCVENDVNLGTLGEYTFGAGRGTRDMVGVFVGTGIGGGLILEGKLRAGARSAAGEIGHMTLMAGGPLCGCGRHGCAEALASRTAIERDIEIGLSAGRESLIPQLTEGGKKPINSSVLANALHQGDPLVTEIMDRAQWYLGLLTASIVNILDPQVVVFGGGVVESLGQEFVDPIAATARQHFILQAGASEVRIVPSELGDHAGVLGAAVHARQKASAVPVPGAA
ncbi:MAG: ROK family protein [Anaerolineae bacterium]|nr:ROK family protein [Anaerolineae bacterium]